MLVVCAACTAGCGAASDDFDEVGAGSSFGGGSSSAAGTTAVGGGGSVASGGQFASSGGSGTGFGSGGSFQSAGAGSQLGGSAGTLATGGTSGSGGGRFNFGGSGDGKFGSGGSGGAKSGSGGSSGSGGAKSGSGGSGGGKSGSAGSGGSGGSAPTWTEIYTKYLSNAQYSSNCNGANCHNPGKAKGYDFSTQANGYASVKSKTSQFVSVLSSGSMPQGKPKMPAADLAVIKAWVAAGAMNN